VATPSETVTYTLVVTDSLGCTDTAYVTITLDYFTNLGLPNIFSPNGDGNNDVLYVRGSGVNTLQFMIYDRWGEKVFETSNMETGWDGTYKGKDLNSAVFVYLLEATMLGGSILEKKGNITLVR